MVDSPDSVSDQELLRAIAARDSAALRALFERYGPTALALANFPVANLSVYSMVDGHSSSAPLYLGTIDTLEPVPVPEPGAVAVWLWLAASAWAVRARSRRRS